MIIYKYSYIRYEKLRYLIIYGAKSANTVCILDYMVVPDHRLPYKIIYKHSYAIRYRKLRYLTIYEAISANAICMLDYMIIIDHRLPYKIIYDNI